VTWLWASVPLLGVLGSVLAVAEASIGRMSRVRAMALREGGYANAGLLERIEEEPARFLNAIYLAALLVQNGSAVLVAILSERHLGGIAIPLVSVAFTLAYFVVVEAMCKTFGILHGDRAALTVAPFVWGLGQLLAPPTRLLIGLANLLLPGKGLPQGPFVVEQEIRSMAELGHAAGIIEEHEKELIHSVFEFGDTVVRKVMVPRPDIVAAEVHLSLAAVQELMVRHGFSRLPVCRDGLDRIEGFVFAKDVLSALHQGKHDVPLTEILRPARFIPESKRVAELLREMQRERFRMALVVDEYGSLSGLVTLEDLLEELVGEMADEYDRSEPQIQPVGEGCYRVSGRVSIDDLNALLDTDLPHDGWNTVGGLILGVLETIPHEGQEVSADGLRFRVEKIHGRRIASVVITRVSGEPSPPRPRRRKMRAPSTKESRRPSPRSP
jgi:CBS domain containing-hemolysin-like protein